MKKLRLRELIDFYDHKVRGSSNHASAVNAVLGEDLAIALLTHYFESDGINVRVLSEPCTQGKQRGVRLDKWMVVENKENSVIYQVEIKNWSAHSIGGKSCSPSAEDSTLRQDRAWRWAKRFNIIEKIPAEAATLKVLTKMRIPSLLRSCKHKPLLCFWEALHPDGEPDPFFEVDVKSESFQKLSIFSMSNYVSKLLKDTEFISVKMSDADARIDWLNRIYS